MNITEQAKKTQLRVFIPDTLGVTVEQHYGRGNLKIGLDVYTYSRLPGTPMKPALGSTGRQKVAERMHGTCPGATSECQAICYAARPVTEDGAVYEMWARNSRTEAVPPIPDDCQLLRLHVSGDFTTPTYIMAWVNRLKDRPDVTCWAYTRSWRVAELLPYLEQLRALPNVQLFASMDQSTPELPPAGWRRAWIDGDPRAGEPQRIAAHTELAEHIKAWELISTADGVKNLICPEETKAVPNCQACGFCVSGARNDVVFLRH